MLRKRYTVYIGTLLAIQFAMPLETKAENLNLIPAPKYIHQHEGEFRLAAGLRIAIGSAHAREDRFAAEVLASEINEATGHKPPITTSRMPPAAKAIYLTRLADDVRLRTLLKKFGLDAGDLDAEGYLIHADSKHIWVAATTAQGLFYGVQTLRQLIRSSSKSGVQGRDAKQFACPAV